MIKFRSAHTQCDEAIFQNSKPTYVKTSAPLLTNLTEHVGTLGTAHDLPALPAPPAVHLAPVLVLVEIAAAVEVVALLAHQHLQQGVYVSVEVVDRSAAQVYVARRAVQPLILNGRFSYAKQKDVYVFTYGAVS